MATQNTAKVTVKDKLEMWGEILVMGIVVSVVGTLVIRWIYKVTGW